MIIVEQWILESKKERTKHLKLSEPCIERGGNSTVHRGVLAQYLNTNFPSKVDLCHACYNDKCSNPKHLYWGTRKENVADAQLAGTWKSPYEHIVNKYGQKEAKEMVRENGSKGWSKGGKAGKGKPKSAKHIENLRLTLLGKKKLK